MADLDLKNLDAAVMDRLKVVARKNAITPEEQAKRLLRQSLSGGPDSEARSAAARSIAAMTPTGVVQTDSVDLLREDRSR